MRLIDADRLIINLYHNKKVFLNDDLVKCIYDTETAYSVDKVVEELESFSKLAEDRWTNGTSKYAYQEHKCWVKAIEIVKQGGVSDDVCEWESKYINDKYSYLTSCGNIFIYETNSVYCPYCGKKIKVVEQMTIDEAYNTCFGKPYIVPIDKHEEARNIIRDLIEEVKQYREIGTVEECRNSVLEIDRAYNKAIDDFSNEIDKYIERYDGTIYDEEYYTNVKSDFEDLKKIGDQLKAGVQSEV